MTARELREKYLRFFESKGHSRFPSGSLIPYDVTGKLDESLLFNGAGMVQFKPFFRGTATPPSKRLTNAQKCVRTGDIDEVGDSSHLTFFEMLGNFSFGDYFKAEAIAYSWEFMTSPEWLGLEPKRLSFTIFEDDDEAFELWSVHIRGAGLEPASRIFRLDEETNYWPASAFSKGPPGPCGPNSEMFYWTPNDEPPPLGPYTREDYERDLKAEKWLEIWNDVFIQFEWRGRLRNPERPSDGYEKDGMDPLPFRSVDTGMGFERTAVVLAGLSSIYDTDLFEPILRRIEGVGGRDAGRGTRDEASGSLPLDGGSAPQGWKGEVGVIDGPAGLAHVPGDATPGHPSPLTPHPSHLRYGADPDRDRAIRIIADHLRTACFCIADGILPSNTGRGYVLRRLIRRAVRRGRRMLGFEKPFCHEVYEGVAEAMGDPYSELIERREVIVETLRNEEALCRRSLDAGVGWLIDSAAGGLRQLAMEINRKIVSLGRRFQVADSRIADLLALAPPGGGSAGQVFEFGRTVLGLAAEPGGLRFLSSQLCGLADDVNEALGLPAEGPFVLSGDLAFKLHDSFGLPLEDTVEICRDEGIEVDVEAFERALGEAQQRSRAGDGMANVYGDDEELVLSVSGAANTQTVFLGYETTEAKAKVAQISPRFDAKGLTDGKFQLCLDQTPFYAESGGEVGDTGTISCPEFEFEVTNTWKELGLIWHDVELVRGPAVKGLGKDGILRALNDGIFFKEVDAKVDAARRKAITRNHTATHLLHAALRQVLGKHVTQAGSLVAPEHLRFDFTHGKAMSPKEIAAVERIVNEESLADHDVTVFSDLPIAEAKKKGAIALFGEKYGDRVRMLQVDEFSRELCGGCHVRRTGEIGLFKIVAEGSAASGVRRIEAVTGEAAYKWVLDREHALRQAADLLKTNPSSLVPAVEKALEQLREERKRREKAEQAMVRAATSDKSDKSDRSDRSDKSEQSDSPYQAVGPVHLWAKRFDSVDPKIVASAIDDAVASTPDLVAVAAIVDEGKVSLVCKAGPEAVKHGAHAGNLIREVAKIVGGGGGGRPDFATAGGKDPSRVDAALAAAKELLAEQVV